MEISDVLVALEELKNGIIAVKSANENVERAATAARKVCEAFGACVSRLDQFPQTVMVPIQTKVAELSEASSRMIGSCSESLKELREETTKIAETFSAAVNSSCSRIQDDVNEFHREIEALETKLTRVTSRVEEKTDGVVDEVRKLSGNLHDDIESLSASQSESFAKVGGKIDAAKGVLKREIEAWSDGLGKSLLQESEKTRDSMTAARAAVLDEIGSVKKIAIAAAIFGAVASACAVYGVIRAFGL